MNFAKNARSTLLNTLALAALGFLLSVVLARWLTEPERGVYALVMALVLLGDAVVHLGMRTALIYEVGRVRTPSGRALGTSLWISLAGLCVAGAVAFLCRGIAAERLLGGATPALLWVAFGLTALEVLSGLLEAVSRAIDRFDLRNGLQTASSAATLVAVGVALLAFSAGPLGALLAAAGVRLAVLVWYAVRVVRVTGLELAFDRERSLPMLRYGMVGYVAMVLGKLHERADVMLMALLGVGTAEIAYYAVAVSVIDRLRVVPDSIGSALLPRLSVLPLAETAEYTARVLRSTLLWVAVSGVALALLGPVLLPLVFGAPYAASVAPFFVLIPATALLTVRRVVANFFIASGKPGFNTGVQALAVPLNVLVNLWAIPRFGILGAAFASLVSYGFEGIGTLWGFQRRTGRSWRASLLPTRADLELTLRRLRQTSWLRRRAEPGAAGK